MSGPAQPTPLSETLPRVFDGDIVIDPSGQAWVIIGNAIGQQQKARLGAVPNGWPDVLLVRFDTSPAFAQMAEAPAPAQLAPPTQQSLLKQISDFLGEPFPTDTDCPAFPPEIQSKVQELRDKCREGLRKLRQAVTPSDPEIQKRLIAQWESERKQANTTAMSTIHAVSIGLAQIPYVGAVLAALIELAAAIAGGQVATGPVPQNTPINELIDRDVYRGFSAWTWENQHPLPQNLQSYAEIDRSIQQRRLDFRDYVDKALRLFSLIFKIRFECIFPMYYTENVPPFAVLRDMRLLASVDPNRFKATYFFDPAGTPARYFFEALPDPNSEALKALASDPGQLGTPQGAAAGGLAAFNQYLGKLTPTGNKQEATSASPPASQPSGRPAKPSTK
jgi:hypothetical protein